MWKFLWENTLAERVPSCKAGSQKLPALRGITKVLIRNYKCDIT